MKQQLISRMMMCCACLAAAILQVAPAEAKTLTLYFDFYYNGIKAAEVEDVIRIGKDEYEITSRAKAEGLAKLLYGDVLRKSAGRVSPLAGLLPLKYEEQRGKRARTMMELDEAAGVLNLQKGEEKKSAPLPQEPLTDYLTALYQPMVQRKLSPGKSAATNGWRLKVYDYKTGAPEEVKTGTGTVHAETLFRESERGQRMFWFAPSLEYLPVKIYVNDKGHEFETVLRAIGKKDQ